MTQRPVADTSSSAARVSYSQYRLPDKPDGRARCVDDGWAMPSQLADMVERVAEIRIRQDPTAINHNKEKVREGGGQLWHHTAGSVRARRPCPPRVHDVVG
eukprot:COSAG01_NODE_311_length_19072_cov_73.511727_2_plen_101_part_00